MMTKMNAVVEWKEICSAVNVIDRNESTMEHILPHRLFPVSPIPSCTAKYSRSSRKRKQRYILFFVSVAAASVFAIIFVLVVEVPENFSFPRR